MAQFTYRANLSAKVIPLLAANWGRTVIIPQADNTFSWELSSQEDEDRDTGIPQIYYCHNVLPTAQGFQSIGYQEVIAAPTVPFTDDLSEVYSIPIVDSERVFLGIVGNDWYYRKDSGWAYAITLGSKVSVATVSGVTYLSAPGDFVYKYTSVLPAPEVAGLTGLNEALIKGVVSAAGYLIVWTKALAAKAVLGLMSIGSPVVSSCDSVTDLYEGQPIESAGFPAGTTILSIVGSDVTMTANATGVPISISFVRPDVPSQVLWSSTIDPTDFVPSLITGAGGGAVEEAKGEITHCVSHSLGFIIFTTKNIVAALYTNNVRYPFQFREIVNSGGLTSSARVAADTNSGNVYAYTSSGLQIINSTQAQTVFPEVTDFLAGSIMEDFNETYKQFVVAELNDNMQVRLNIVADRYLVISYGISSYTHALIYDMSMKRWGKLKFTHVKCTEDSAANDLEASFAKKSILFFTAEGKAYRWVFDRNHTSAVGVMILGKYQYVRSRMLQLEEVCVEDIGVSNAFEVVDMPSLDGRTTTNVSGYLYTNLNGFRKYLFQGVVGLNHSLLMQGVFNLNSLVLTFCVHGKM